MRTRFRFALLLLAGLVLLAACGRQPAPPAVEHELAVTVVGDGVVVSDPEGIDTAVDATTAAFESGTVVTLEASAGAGSAFVGWEFGDPDRVCEEGSTDGRCVVTVDGAVDVTATFESTVVTQALSVTVVGDGVVVSDPPGIDTAGVASASFPQGEVVTLEASAGAGSAFVGWEFADPGRVCEAGSGADTCLITLDEDVAVTATFAVAVVTDEITVAVNAGLGSAGRVTSSPSGIDTLAGDFSATFVRGDVLELTAFATTGGFAGWTGGPCDGLKTLTCSLTVADGVPTITANFNAIAEATFQIGANADDVEEFLEAAPGFGGRTFAQGYTYAVSNDIELGFDPDFAPQAVGLRFTGVAVPQGANVLDARLRFTAFASPVTGTSDPVGLRVSGHKVASAPPFATDSIPDAGETSTAAFGVTGPLPTDAEVLWTITEAWTADEVYQSSNLASVVQELVSQDVWSVMNAMALVIEPVDETSVQYRRAYARNEDASKAATLTVQWVPLPPPLP